MNVNLDLVRKYNVAGPRYTSYPPATRFSDTVSWDALADELIENNRSPRPLSIYAHIPFCESLCWFCGCTTVITTQHERSELYLSYLDKEMRQMSALLHPERKTVQLHLGGGTPTFLSPAELRRLGAILHDNFKVAEDCEAGVEIDPRRLSREHLEALREIGFNRASLGVQDFNAKVQEAIHRIQPYEQTEFAINTARELGFESINVDLIYGLPHQTVETFTKTLEQVMELTPDRLAIFSYAHVPWIKPSQKILEQKILPTAEVKLELLKLAIEKLTANGDYVYIGMDHFAKPNDELAIAQKNKTLHRNFQGYSTRGDADIYAFGMSAISKTDNAYWQNKKEVPDYYADLDAGKQPLHRAYFLTEDDKIRRETIMRLMCHLTLNFSEIERKFGINFRDYFASELNSFGDMTVDGLVTISEDRIGVTSEGRIFIRNIARRFDATLPKEQERRFSKTI